MKRLMPVLLMLTACGAEAGGPDETPSSPNNVKSIDDTPLIVKFEASGNTISAYEPTPGALLIAERAKLGGVSALRDLGPTSSLAELYSKYVSGPVPAAVLDFDARSKAAQNGPVDDSEPAGAPAAPEGSPERAVATPGQSVMHESGATHFATDHCPTSPHPSSLVGLIPASEIDIHVRSFCWSAGHILNWSEPAFAAVQHHAVAALFGPLSFVMRTDSQSWSKDILANEQWFFFSRNSLAWHRVTSCPPGATCAALTLPRRATMSGAVFPASNTVWRFGGTFWTHNQALL
jgi:hypothetical protein